MEATIPFNYVIIAAETTGVEIITSERAVREDVALQTYQDYQDRYPGKRIILGDRSGNIIAKTRD